MSKNPLPNREFAIREDGHHGVLRVSVTLGQENSVPLLQRHVVPVTVHR